VRASAQALFEAGLIWLLYMALEPFVRRRWPESIVGWARLIGGGFSDPLVGRDLLVGTVFGVAHLLVQRSRFFLEGASTGVVSIPFVGPLWNLAGPGSFLANLLDALGEGIQFTMILLFFLFLGIAPSRVRWRGPIIFGAIYTLMAFLASTSTSLPVRILISVVSAVLVTTVLARFGALAAITANLVTSWGAWLSLDFSAWYAPQTIVLWLLLIALGAGAFVVSLGRRVPLLSQVRRA
jgi:serine/threonine-protein kinase